ncbi:atypical/RIO/RIO1 protein kinase [Sphaeroforma arctica JP610]|uniref:Serine/threonine-protein kinase RIO1 n=1 Tax=Sphaeroforma arctica JP610 TaxID=667725 RepID=A0A0L0G3N3_9EUKA|nr:atypical/RIO/RIO1 protein kinase [Sphaeroforma arctica JP610]KNC83717.1 atypical/RIO/RIO1 protein kinase [Sphaeroforma arctica JP610]|eukprot:XP_014157619.1 atypical/RIO/RIO1 protein kinase [Sphaeroforma arctica JP610]
MPTLGLDQAESANISTMTAIEKTVPESTDIAENTTQEYDYGDEDDDYYDDSTEVDEIALGIEQEAFMRYGDPNDFVIQGSGQQANPAHAGAGGKRMQPQEQTLRKYYNKINVETNLSKGATSKLSSGKGSDSSSYRTSDKADRATTEQVLDPRTRMILFKMMSAGVFNEIHGCVSTGKEANVYHAFTEDRDAEFAIKVYKTSILVFKDRDRYVSGEFRFRKGYCASNPRKMVKLWAEKEMRNYIRLFQAGIPTPRMIMLRQHVLVMEFLGKDGWAAPRLKDATISADRHRSLYMQCVKDMRKMFHVCKLVHGDLSEYNLLYWKQQLYFIDVSQSVEHEHPRALDFLRKDCSNITAFFKKNGVDVMSMRELFEFVTDPNLQDEHIDEYLEKAQEKIAARGDETAEDKVAEAVFQHAYIPRTLDDVVDFERDHERMQRAAKSGETVDLIYAKILGLEDTPDNKTNTPQKKDAKDIQSQTSKLEMSQIETSRTQDSVESDSDAESISGKGSESEGESGDDSDSETGKAWVERPPKMSAEEKKALKRAHKKEVKDDNKEKRKGKMPKKAKKRREKTTTTKK